MITIIFMGVNVIIVFIINVINDKGNYWLVFDNENPAAIILTPSDTVTKINVTIFIIFLLFLLIFDSQVYFTLLINKSWCAMAVEGDTI